MSTPVSPAHIRQNVCRALLLGSFLLLPVTFYYLSPYLIIMRTGERTASGSMVVFGVMTLTALALGRLFCGWVCPAGGLGEALFAVQNGKANNRFNGTRSLVWVPWVAVVVLVTLQSGGIERVDVLYQTDHGVSLTTVGGMGPDIIFYVVLALIFVLSLTAGKRGFCHHACWMAPFMMIGRGVRNALRLSAVQLCANTPACIGCRACTTSCPMTLEVHTMVLNGRMENNECILCGACVDVCPYKVIRYDFGRPLPASPAQTDKP